MCSGSGSRNKVWFYWTCEHFPPSLPLKSGSCDKAPVNKKRWVLQLVQSNLAAWGLRDARLMSVLPLVKQLISSSVVQPVHTKPRGNAIIADISAFCQMGLMMAKASPSYWGEGGVMWCTAQLNKSRSAARGVPACSTNPNNLLSKLSLLLKQKNVQWSCTFLSGSGTSHPKPEVISCNETQLILVLPFSVNNSFLCFQEWIVSSQEGRMLCAQWG